MRVGGADVPAIAGASAGQAEAGRARARRTSLLVWAILLGGAFCFAWAALHTAARFDRAFDPRPGAAAGSE